MQIELEYIDEIECSICGENDEGIIIEGRFEAGDCFIETEIAICESCWARWFKEFQKEK